MRQPSGKLILLAKYPQPGLVKTRLAQDLGPQSAAQIAEVFLQDFAKRLSKAALPMKATLCFSPATARLQMKRLLGDTSKFFEFRAQGSGNLGERLAMAMALRAPTIFLGSDAPDIPFDEIRKALKACLAGRAYILHAHDGGYVLLGVPSGTPNRSFSNIAWSTPETGIQQVASLRLCGISVDESPRKWWDVDDLEGLKALYGRLIYRPRIAKRTLKTLEEIFAK